MPFAHKKYLLRTFRSRLRPEGMDSLSLRLARVQRISGIYGSPLFLRRVLCLNGFLNGLPETKHASV